MLIIDDDSPLLEGAPLIIPIGIREEGEEVRITYYKDAKEVAEFLSGVDGERLFDPETIKIAERMIASLPAFSDYEPDPEHSADFCHLFRLSETKKLKRSLIREDSEIIMPDHGYENLTECEPDMLDEGALMFGTVKGGKILSVAYENPSFGDEGELIDIAVETAEGYENLGYGKSNVAKLCSYLLDPGKVISYIAQSSNTASVKIAEAVGFERVGREFQLAMYKKD